MYVVYVLKMSNAQLYVGYTNNLTRRLQEHNNGYVLYTKRYKPWKIETYIAFHNQDLAINFEKYLKTSSGKVLLNRRFVTI